MNEICLAHLGNNSDIYEDILFLKYFLKNGIFKYVVIISYEKKIIGNKSLFLSFNIKSINNLDFSIINIYKFIYFP